MIDGVSCTSHALFSRSRKWSPEDDIIECELFLMKEKKHTEETYPFQLVRTFVYRERSIDDGSHYDPNLDKANIIKEWKHNKKLTKDFLKSKKKSGLEKVKDLFKSKKSNGVDDSEVRSRYREYSPNLEPPPVNLQQDISNRRRLSTPTASPVTTNRSKSLPPKANGKKANGVVSAPKRDKENGGQKFNWCASLDRLSSKKKTRVSIKIAIRALPTHRAMNKFVLGAVKCLDDRSKVIDFASKVDQHEEHFIERVKQDAALLRRYRSR
jgi:hypothetical protein